MKETRTRERGTPDCPEGHKQIQTSGCREENTDRMPVEITAADIGQWAKKTEEKERKGTV